MNFTKDTSGDSCKIIMSGKFTFADHANFKEILEIFATKEISRVILDFGNVEFVDSAALGMLLLAREEAEKGGISLGLHNPQGQIEKMFKVSKFDTLFDVSN